MPTRRSRRNVAQVIYNAREAEAALPPQPQGRISVIDDEDESGDEFPDEQDDAADADLKEVSELGESSDPESEEADSSDSESESRKAKRRPRRRVPEPMYPEDVPWKSPLAGPEPDPQELKYHPYIGWLILYMSTFAASFEDLPGYGPQDIEEGVIESNLNTHKLFARLLGLVLNRKKEIEYKRYVSALQELHSLLPSLGSTYRLSPNLKWKSQDVFDELEPIERLEMLHLLAVWSLQNSKTILTQMSKLSPDAIFCYTGLDDELNKYYFCKGFVGDTRFRLYRETNPYIAVVNWTPVASDPDELQAFVEGLKPATTKDCRMFIEVLEEFLPSARESEERRLKDAKKMRRLNTLAARTTFVSRNPPRESRRSRAERVDYSMLAYDEQFDRVVSKRDRHDRDWGSPAPELGSRQSRRVRGGPPPEHETLQQLELERQRKEMEIRRAREESKLAAADSAMEDDEEPPAHKAALPQDGV